MRFNATPKNGWIHHTHATYQMKDTLGLTEILCHKCGIRGLPQKIGPLMIPCQGTFSGYKSYWGQANED